MAASPYENNWKSTAVTSPDSGAAPSDSCCRGCSPRGRRCLRQNLMLLLLLASLILGIVLGVCMRLLDPPLTEREQVYFRFPGDLLMRMLKCLIIPLIVSSLIAGLGGIDTRASGKMGLYSIIYYLTTTILAVLLGILLVMTIKPGVNADDVEATGDAEKGNVADSFLDLIRNMFPDNIVEACFRQTKTFQIAVYGNETNLLNDTAMNSTDCMDTFGMPTCKYTEESVVDYNPSTEKQEGMNILGLVVYSIAMGIVASRLGPAGRPLYNFAHSVAEATMMLVTAVIWYSPVGIMFLVASEIIRMEDPLAELEALGMYIVTVVTGLLIHGFIVLPLIYLICVRANPYRYILGTLQAMITALGTASSSATLPVTYRCLEENNGIDRRVTRFVLPVGATINMDGTALYEAVAAIFIAQSNGLVLSAADVVAISITATLASIGAASVPQAGLVTMIIVLSVIGLPAEEVTKIIAVDWLLDRIRTMVNVEGDAIGSAVIYHFTKDRLSEMDREDGVISEMTERREQESQRDTYPEKTESHIKDGIVNNGYIKDGSGYFSQTGDLSTNF